MIFHKIKFCSVLLITSLCWASASQAVDAPKERNVNVICAGLATVASGYYYTAIEQNKSIMESVVFGKAFNMARDKYTDAALKQNRDMSREAFVERRSEFMESVVSGLVAKFDGDPFTFSEEAQIKFKTLIVAEGKKHKCDLGFKF